MKHLLLICCFFACANTNAQFAVFKSVDTVCACISASYDGVKDSEERINKMYEECTTNNIIWPSEKELEKMTVDLKDDEIQPFFEQFATKVFRDLADYLIADCEVWHMHYYRRRQTMIEQRKEQPNEEMIAKFSEVLEKEISLETLINRSFCYLSLGDLEMAEKDLVRCMELSQDNAKVYYLGGEIAEAGGEYDSAIELYRKAYNLSDNQQYFILIHLTRTKARLLGG